MFSHRAPVLTHGARKGDAMRIMRVTRSVAKRRTSATSGGERENPDGETLRERGKIGKKCSALVRIFLAGGKCFRPASQERVVGAWRRARREGPGRTPHDARGVNRSVDDAQSPFHE